MFYHKNGNNRRNGQTGARLCAAVLAAMLLLEGCAKEQEDVPQIVLTTGFNEDEVFRVDNISCYRQEVLIYLVNLYNQYRKVFGDEILSNTVGGVTLAEEVQSTALARLVKIKMMNLMAENYQLSLTQEEEEKVQAAAISYYGTLTDTEIAALGSPGVELVAGMYREYLIAEKVYDLLTAEVNTEVSDDEARTIVVEQIGLHAYYVGEDGERVTVSESERTKLRNRAEDIAGRIQDGEDFEELAFLFSDEEELRIEVTRGKSADTIVEACAPLAEGEISSVVEYDDTFYIFCCVSAFDREQTDNRKREIVEERRRETFEDVYRAFEESRDCYLNEELWNGFSFVPTEGVNTSSFMDVFEQYL